jgi:hypothetical protein
VLDGQRLPLDSEDAGADKPRLTLQFLRVDAAVAGGNAGRQVVWRKETLPGRAFQMSERGPDNYGPGRQAFARPFVIVVPKAAAGVERSALLDLASYLSNSFMNAQGTGVRVLFDDEVLSDHDHFNQVLVGGPEINSITRSLMLQIGDKVGSGFPVVFPTLQSPSSKFGSDFKVGPCSYTGEGHAVAFLAPFWADSATCAADSDRQTVRGEARLRLVLAANDIPALEDAVRFSFSMNQPLTRAPFTNMAPDFTITSKRYRWQGVGGYAGLGFMGNNWEYLESMSYATC